MRIGTLEAARDYDRIFLSPHPDDAALSCGGTISCGSKQGRRQLVITLCSAIPASAEGAWHQRLDEEERGLGILGVDYLLAGFLDAPFRHEAYREDGNLFRAPVSDDVLQGQLGSLLPVLAKQNRQATLYAPLAVGSHVDHRIACDAAKGSGQFASVCLYEDFPYTVKDPGALEVRLGELGVGVTARVTDIRHGFERKVEAIGQYASQVSFLFGSFDAALRALTEAGRQISPGGLGERIWIVAPATLPS